MLRIISVTEIFTFAVIIPFKSTLSPPITSLLHQNHPEEPTNDGTLTVKLNKSGFLYNISTFRASLVETGNAHER